MNTLTLITLLLAATALDMQVAGIGIGFNTNVDAEGRKVFELDLDDTVKCIKENGATTDDLIAFLGNQTASFETREIQCVSGCFFQSAGAINEAGLDRAGYLELRSELFGVENATKAADECEEVLAAAPKDICSIGGAFFKCDMKVYQMYI